MVITIPPIRSISLFSTFKPNTDMADAIREQAEAIAELSAVIDNRTDVVSNG